MEILKFSIAAGETKRFEKAGRYIEVLEADQELSLLFFDESGGQVDDAQDIVSGLYIEEPYRAFNVYSELAQSVELLVSNGRGGSRRQPGNVTIIDKIDPSCATLTTSTAVTGFLSTQLVAPAANVRGLIVRASICNATGGSTQITPCRIVGAMASPGVLTGGAQQVILNSSLAAVGGSDRVQLLDSRRYIPPGWGLFMLTDCGTVGGNASTVVSYELL